MFVDSVPTSMGFESRFKQALEQRIPEQTDGYTELKYSDTFYVHVASHPNGAGSFEIYAIVPHNEVDTELVDRKSGGQLSMNIPGADQFYNDIIRPTEEVTENSYSNLVFYLQEVVDDGAWNRDATMYCTHELQA